MKDIAADLQKSDSQKIQLAKEISFTSSRDIDEERIMHSNSEKIEIISHDKTDEIIEGFYE